MYVNLGMYTCEEITESISVGESPVFSKIQRPSPRRLPWQCGNHNVMSMCDVLRQSAHVRFELFSQEFNSNGSQL